MICKRITAARYRMHMFDHNGDFIQSFALHCDNIDALAIGAARKLAGKFPFEIWQLDRRVESPDRGSRDQQANDRAPSNAVHSRTSYSNATPSGSFS